MGGGGGGYRNVNLSIVIACSLNHVNTESLCIRPLATKYKQTQTQKHIHNKTTLKNALLL